MNEITVTAGTKRRWGVARVLALLCGVSLLASFVLFVVGYSSIYTSRPTLTPDTCHIGNPYFEDSASFAHAWSFIPFGIDCIYFAGGESPDSTHTFREGNTGAMVGVVWALSAGLALGAGSVAIVVGRTVKRRAS